MIKRCKNCIFYEPNTIKFGNCSKVKQLINFRFAYKEENPNLEDSHKPLKPLVQRHGICDNWVDKKNKHINIYE